MDRLEFFGNKHKNTPELVEVISTSSYVGYGVDNQFPQYLYDLYLHSALLNSIINGTADYVLGGGIESVDILDIVYIKNSIGDTLEDTIKKCIIDDLIFGGFAVKISRNTYDEIVDIEWVDLQLVRINKEQTVAYLWKDKKKMSNSTNAKKYPLYNPQEKHTTSILYFKGHLTRGVYAVPRWIGALAAVETSTEISKFHLNSIHNNFSGNFIINYNSADFTEEEKREIQRGIKENFCGTENAAKFMLAFNNGKENAITIARIPEDNFDKKYDALKESTTKDIFVAFRAVPQLFGFSTEGTGFNKQEFKEAFSLYNSTVCQSIREDIKRVFDGIYGVQSLIFKPFILED